MRKPKSDWESIKNSVNINGTVPIICNKSQFKGNTINIHTQQNIKEGRSIMLHNSYYTGSVNQKYNIDKDITISEYYTYTPSPQWLERKIKAIVNKYQLDIIGFNMCIKMNELNIKFSAYQYVADMKHTDKGLTLQGNLGNLSVLKDIQILVREARNVIKHTDIDELIKLSDIDLQMKLNSNPIEGMNINMKALKVHDRRMSDRS